MAQPLQMQVITETETLTEHTHPLAEPMTWELGVRQRDTIQLNMVMLKVMDFNH